MSKQIDSPKTAKRELAQRLYVDSNYTQEEVARIIGVTRQTVIRWAKEHHWQELKAATSVSPAEQIRQLRQQIANINDAILTRPLSERWATPAEADSLNKLATAIAKLEKDVGIEDLVSVAMAMTRWLRTSDPERAKELSNLFNAYIQDVTGGVKR
nr:YfeC-like transcriptional regulator [uncultured Porphyromonas sp.]